jgi:RES domain-containing protein
VRVVYVSQTLSLCALEALVHFGIDDAPEDFSALSVNVPDGLGVEQLELSRLPGDWRTYPAPAALQELGTEWARSGRTLLLSVPSAVIPAERNFLINPLHPDFGKLGFGKPEPFSFDPRLLHP